MTTVTVSADDLRTVLDARSQHSHRRPGIWDSDNRPEIAGTRCKECAARPLTAHPPTAAPYGAGPASAENTRTMWRDTWWQWLCSLPHNPADTDPPHSTPWGPM